MTILDTDTLTLLELGHDAVRRRVAGSESVAITIVTRLEKLRGRIDAVIKANTSAELIRKQDRLTRTELFLADFPILSFDATSAAHFDRLSKAKPTRSMGRADLLIACIALAHGATLATRNSRDFADIPGLRAENWAD